MVMFLLDLLDDPSPEANFILFDLVKSEERREMNINISQSKK